VGELGTHSLDVPAVMSTRSGEVRLELSGPHPVQKAAMAHVELFSGLTGRDVLLHAGRFLHDLTRSGQISEIFSVLHRSELAATV